MLNAFDVMLASVSPWQNRVDAKTADLFDSVTLLPNLDFLERSQSNPMLCMGLLLIDELHGFSLEPDQLSLITGVDPGYFSNNARWEDLPEQVRFAALGRLTERVLRSWRNKVREDLILPTLGCCDPFERVTG